MDHEEGEVSNYRGDVKGYDQDGQVETKKKSRFSGKSTYERMEERRRKKEEKRRRKLAEKRSRSRSYSRHSSRHYHSRHSNSRSYSRSRSRSYSTGKDEDLKKNNTEATNPAANENKPAEENPQAIPEAEDPNNVHKQCERAVIEATRRADELLRKRGLLEDTTPKEEKKEEKVEEEKKEVEEETYELPKALQEKIEKDTKTGPFSWYKPATAASVTSLLEKKENYLCL